MVNYAFTWLENLYGKVQLFDFEECVDYPQELASAASAISSEELCGAKYKVILPLAVQVVQGVNYIFLVEESFSSTPPARRLITLAVNSFEGKFTLVKESIREVL